MKNFFFKALRTSAALSITAGFTGVAIASPEKAEGFFNPQNLKVSSQGERLRYVAFTKQDALSQAPMSSEGVVLPDGRVVSVDAYVAELNAMERELSAAGTTLRSSEAALGTIATSRAGAPHFQKNLQAQSENPNSALWSHQLSHELASISSSGSITQNTSFSAGDARALERTTQHSLSGRYLDTQHPSLAQVVQRVVRNKNGDDQKEILIYVNGRQVFRRGRADSNEARVWKNAFDVPLKSITIPVGPGSVEAKLGIRGTVELDLELNPVASDKPEPQFALEFKPHVTADGYVLGATTPTNVGDAGIEGAITLADNTLNVKGSAALARAFKLEVKALTVDNIFAGFDGRIVAYANVNAPGNGSSKFSKKRFEKEFYAWDGVKVEQRLYEYKAPSPQ
jgi:hypothetical protein